MYLDKINHIFIHIDKNGGNYLAKNFIKNKLTSDKIVKKNHDDGKDDFRIIGKFTQHKHQNLNDYMKLLKTTPKKVKVVTSIRDPLDRIISFYFATSNRMKTNKLIKKINYQLYKFFKTNLPFSKKFYKYEKPKLIESEFINFMNNIPSQKEKFLFNDQFFIPDFIIQFSNLNKDLEIFLSKHIKNFEIIENKINSNQFYSSKEKEDIYNNKNIINEFLKSKHFDDYKFFKIPINKNIS